MAETTVGQALAAGLRSVTREAWLAAVGMTVSLARGLLAFPAIAFAVAVTWLALRGSLSRGAGPGEALLACAFVLASPRARSIAAGLWLAGLLLFGALRIAWIAGALPELWQSLSGEPRRPVFASGIAYRFGRVAVAAVAALALDACGQAMALASGLAALALLPVVRETGGFFAVSVVAAVALTGSLLMAASLSVVGDLAVVRAAMAGEAPGRAFAGALAAFALRPAAFVAASLGVSLGALLAVGSLESLFGILAGIAGGAPRILLLAPQFLLAALSSLLAAAAELWRLSALGALALGTDASAQRAPRAISAGTGRP